MIELEKYAVRFAPVADDAYSLNFVRGFMCIAERFIETSEREKGDSNSMGMRFAAWHSMSEEARESIASSSFSDEIFSTFALHSSVLGDADSAAFTVNVICSTRSFR